jgi:ankyrin repeat protein
MSNIFDRIDVYDEESTPAAIVDYIASNQGCVNDKRHDNTTPLHLAISKKIPKIVDALLKHHANPNSQDGNGQTPLHLAISIDEPVIVKSLLGCQSADIDSPDNHGRTPLWLSARTGDIEIVEALVERNCSIAVRCRTCELTPLHIAVQNRHHDIARYLIEKKADLEAADAEGETPLFKAIRNCDFEMVHILKGASRTHQRKDGKTIQALSDDGAFERTVQETYGGLDEYVKVRQHRITSSSCSRHPFSVANIPVRGKKYPTSPRNSKVDRHENSKDEDEERKPAASTQKDKDHSTGVSNPPAVVSNSPTGSDPTPKNSTDAPPNPYLDSLVTHITRNGLQRLFGGGDERQLRNHLRANAEQAGALANAIGINHGSLAAFALLTIYDVAILIGKYRSPRRKALECTPSNTSW